MNDGSSILWSIAILFGIGFGIVRWMPRIRPLEERIRNWAIGLGIVSGFVFFFADPFPNRRSSDDLSSMIGGSAFLGALAGFAWFFVIASLTFAYQYVIASPFRLLGSWKRRLSERRAKQSEERRRLREQREWERSAPGRERADREAAARKQAEETMKGEAQKRREDARASCELFFGLHAAEIGSRYPRDQFDAFVAKYMTDKHAPEDVERRAEQLQALIEQHRELVKPTPRFATIEELARWFQEQKQRIESLPIEEKAKRTHLVELNQRYSELTSELLQKMKP